MCNQHHERYMEMECCLSESISSTRKMFPTRLTHFAGRVLLPWCGARSWVGRWNTGSIWKYLEVLPGTGILGIQSLQSSALQVFQALGFKELPPACRGSKKEALWVAGQGSCIGVSSSGADSTHGGWFDESLHLRGLWVLRLTVLAQAQETSQCAGVISFGISPSLQLLVH